MTEDDSGTESSSVIQLRALGVLRTPTLGVTGHVRCCAPPPALRAGVLLRTACGGRLRSAKSLGERSVNGEGGSSGAAARGAGAALSGVEASEVAEAFALLLARA